MEQNWLRRVDYMGSGDCITIAVDEISAHPSLRVRCFGWNEFLCEYQGLEGCQLLAEDVVDGGHSHFRYVKEGTRPLDALLISRTGVKEAVLRFLQYGGSFRDCLSWVQDRAEAQ